MSNSQADRTAGEIDWPTFADRTPPGRRTRSSKYKVPMGQAIEELADELLSRVGADDWRLSTAAPHREKDGLPYADARPDDPGAVVRWTKGGEQYAVACDKYTSLRDNIRTIGLYVREKRKMDNRPVKTVRDEFATAALPSGDDDAIVADEPPHEILGVQPDAPEPVVEAALRERKKDAHPDQGGSSEELQRVIAAGEQMLGD